MRRSLVASLILVARVAAADTSATQDITGGTATTVGEFPNVVAILVGGGICTGTLVAPTWVLSAGHCVNPEVTHLADHAAVVASIQVIVGTVNAGLPGGTKVKAKETYDPGFSPQVYGVHDISLIELASPVTSVTPAVVNLDPTNSPIGTAVTMVGYGATTGGGNPGKEFTVGDRASAKCSDVVPASTGVTLDDGKVMCYSQADGKGVCGGDSGGPAFAIIDGVPQVVAVTSFGDTNCAAFGVDFRTDTDADFLLSHVDLCPATDPNCGSSGGGCCAVASRETGTTALLGLGVVAFALRRRRRS